MGTTPGIPVNPGTPIIHVVVVYTAAAAGATGDINGLIDTAILETNESYQNSNVSQRVALAHSQQINYNEAGGDYDDHLNRVDDADVANMRNQYGGDVAVLLVDDGAFCGQAEGIGLNAIGDNAFVAVHYDCAPGYPYSFGHEIAHLQGARHDTFVDNDNTPFPYGHGYVDPNGNWRTIMAYPNACNGCTRLQYWSNPDVPHPTTGQAMGTAAESDVARVLDVTGIDLAGYRGPNIIYDASQTISGNVTFEAGWEIETLGNVGVTFSGNVTIENGIEFLMGNNSKFTFNGAVTATGTYNNPIRFKRANASNQWSRLYIKGNNSSFDYVVLTGGYKPVEILSTGNTFKNSRFSGNWRGISSGYTSSGQRSSFTLDNCVVENNTSVGVVGVHDKLHGLVS